MNPEKLADLLIEEIKNISTNNVNGKEVILYKGLYCLSGKEELFREVSDTLRNLSPLYPFEYRKNLEIEIKQASIIKTLSEQEKKKIIKENEEDIKNKYKQLKLINASEYKRFEILTHTMNENILDSIIMQIVSNFKEQKSTKSKRPFDIIFNKELKFVGISLTGKKKYTGCIIFTN